MNDDACRVCRDMFVHLDGMCAMCLWESKRARKLRIKRFLAADSFLSYMQSMYAAVGCRIYAMVPPKGVMDELRESL